MLPLPDHLSNYITHCILSSNCLQYCWQQLDEQPIMLVYLEALAVVLKYLLKKQFCYVLCEKNIWGWMYTTLFITVIKKLMQSTGCLLWFGIFIASGECCVYRWTIQESPKVKPKILNQPLVVGCSTSHPSMSLGRTVHGSNEKVCTK